MNTRNQEITLRRVSEKLTEISENTLGPAALNYSDVANQNFEDLRSEFADLEIEVISVNPGRQYTAAVNLAARAIKLACEAFQAGLTPLPKTIKERELSPL